MPSPSGEGTYAKISIGMFSDREHLAVYGVCLLIAGILLWQWVLPRQYTPGSVQKGPEQACSGEPIFVGYAYNYAPGEPHECKVQCLDNRPRYIAYSNGLATQCGTPPNCFDWGEDQGVTCIIEAKTAVK